MSTRVFSSTTWTNLAIVSRTTLWPELKRANSERALDDVVVSE
jgi:hypothetical protein